MSTKPSTLAPWATSATGIARTVDPAGAAADGYTTSDRVPAGWLNYALHQLGLWVEYLSDQDFSGTTQLATLNASQNVTFDQDLAVTGTIVAAGITTSDADIHHGTRTLIFDSATHGQIISNFALAGTPQALELAASTTGACIVSFPVDVGMRLKVVRVIVSCAGGAASDMSAELAKVTAAVGGTEAFGTSVAAVNSTATANVQAITLTPTADTITADERYFVLIAGSNTAGLKRVVRIEVDVDRP